MSATTAIRDCPRCGQENPPVASFCLACGTPLDAPGARDERRIVTVIFVDLVGFTATAERLDPEDVRAVLAPYHDRVRTEIESFGGVVEKFIGDAVMGVFGAPTAHGDDADRAVRAALVVRDAAAEVGGGLGVRIAVNTGEAVVSLGARPALGEAMVAGDVVNTAARLQTAAPVNGVVVGAETHRLTRDAIAYEPAAAVTAKGKEHPVEAWLALYAVKAVGERGGAGAEVVGRTSELAILEALWERAAGHRLPHLVSVLGPQGIGKTRLAEAFARTVEAAGGRVVHGRSLPYRESGTYGALASQLLALCGAYASDPPEVLAERLRARADEVLGDGGRTGAHLGLLVGVDTGIEAPDRDALFQSVRRFLAAVAAERPLLLVFEDVHWADGNLLDLIHALALRVRDLPLFLLALARPDLLDRRDDWGAGLAGYTALTLAPLPHGQARALAARRLRGADDRLDEVVAIAEGNPLFIEQLAASIGETGTGRLPTNVRAIVAARLDALPPAERSLVLDAAVVGKVFWTDALVAVGDGGPDPLPLLEELERRDLVRRHAWSALEGREQWTFTHGLIRDVAYELLPRAQRAGLHRRVAEFFVEAGVTSSEAMGALAHHWRDAGDHQRAVEHLVLAAEQAERGWAKDHATVLYREALQLVREDDAETRSVLRRRLALASSASFHLDDVRREGSPPA